MEFRGTLTTGPRGTTGKIGTARPASVFFAPSNDYVQPLPVLSLEYDIQYTYAGLGFYPQSTDKRKPQIGAPNHGQIGGDPATN